MRWFATFLLLTPIVYGQTVDTWTSLFDGKGTDGWHMIGPGKAAVKGGEIHVTSQRKAYLITRRHFGDFIFEAEVNIDVGGNSGIQFRSHPTDRFVVGYQAEVDTKPRAWSGGLYDENRRGWLAPLEGRDDRRAAFKNGQWNRYRVHCIGDWIRIWVNDILTTDFRDGTRLSGVIGLQHHGEKGKTVRWRKLRVKHLGWSRWRRVFDGQTMNGWKSNGHGEWAVRDGALVGTNEKNQKNHGLIFLDGQYGDATIRFSFNAVKGNSGLYFRVEPKDGGAGCAGFQAEVESANDVGGLYETGGRAWVVKPTAEDIAGFFKPGEWNRMSVAAHGRDVLVKVNGRPSAQLTDDPGRTEGKIGLQLHGSQDVEVRFRDIEILEVGKGSPVGQPRRLFNGTDLTGWRTFRSSLSSTSTHKATAWAADGILQVSGKGPGYAGTTISHREYSLSLEWRFDPNGKRNPGYPKVGGIIVHAANNDFCWPDGVRIDLTEEHAGDIHVSGKAAFEGDASRRDPEKAGRFGRQGDVAERPHDEWNRLEVTCTGRDVRVFINGVAANEGRSTFADSGRILLLSTGSAIQFRNIKLTPIEP